VRPQQAARRSLLATSGEEGVNLSRASFVCATYGLVPVGNKNSPGAQHLSLSRPQISLHPQHRNCGAGQTTSSEEAGFACAVADERALLFRAGVLAVYLKTQGVATENHPVKKELERVQLYLQKVQKAEAAGGALSPALAPSSSALIHLSTALPRMHRRRFSLGPMNASSAPWSLPPWLQLSYQLGTPCG
jgi:hypothetical protein